MTEQSQIRCRGPRSCHSVDSVLSVQNKIFTRDGKKLIKILGTVASIESCTNRQLDGIWKTCEDLSWNHRTSTPHRSETNGIAERAVRRVKEGRQQYCYNQDQMKGGGQTLWNAIAICEMSKTSWQMRKRHTKDDLENHSEDRSYLLVQWLNIIRYRHEINQDFTNLARKYYEESLWAMS